MPFDFPDTPSNGQTLTGPGGVQYRWDGVKWVSVAAPSAYLPLTGGTLSGPVDAPVFTSYANRVQTGGGYMNAPLNIYSELSGTWTSGNTQVAKISVLSDTMDAAAAGGITTLSVQQQSGGAASTGNRLGMFIDFHYAGGPTNQSRGAGNMYSGLWSYSYANGSNGGGPTTQYGVLWGAVLSATLQSGATNWEGVTGLEVNAGVSTGASAYAMQGISIAIQNHDQAPTPRDCLLALAAVSGQCTQYSPLGISFGSWFGAWPMDAAATLIGTAPTAPTLPVVRPYTARNGVDFSAVTFSGSAFKSNGFTVDAAGAITSGGLHLGANNASSPTDLSRHIELYAGGYAGFNVSGGNLNYVSGAAHVFYAAGVAGGYINSTGLNSMPIGAQAPNTGAFSTVTASGAVTAGTVRAPTIVADTGMQVTAGNITALSGNVSGTNVSATATMTVNGVNVATTAQLPIASSTTPVMDGTAAAGSGTTWSRSDHVHPTDTSRYAASNPSGYQTAAQVTAVVPVASSTTPVMNGTAAVGTGTTWARADHVHATDTSRAPLASPAFTGTVSSAGAVAAPGQNITAQRTQLNGTNAGDAILSVVQTGGTVTYAGIWANAGKLVFGFTNAAMNSFSPSVNINADGSVTTGTGLTVQGGLTVINATALNGMTNTGAVTGPLPAAKTGTAYTVAATDYALILNPSGAFVLTLPSASSSTGRIIKLKLIAAFAVTSSLTNIVPLAGGSAAQAIMPATAGKYCVLQSDGANWQIMEAN